MIEEPPTLAFRGEEWLSALLLAMVIEHCSTAQPDDLDSHGSADNADAMRQLHSSGDIEIIEEDGAHIIGKVTPEGRALLDQLRAHQRQWPA